MSTTIPTNEKELATDLYARVDDMLQAKALEATVEGEGFTALDVAQAIEDSLPEDYPVPSEGKRYRIVAIHGLVSDRARELLEDVPGAFVEVPTAIQLPAAPLTPDCPSWCNYHREESEGWHFGKIIVNDIEIEIEWDEQNPDYGQPRVDICGLNWVHGPEATDLAEALHIAERLLSAPGQVTA